MTTRIQVKRGYTTPTGLTAGELAYNVTDSRLYIGNTGDQKWIGGEVTGGVDMGGGNAASEARLPTQRGVYEYTRANFVGSVNGATGAITDVARTSVANTFTPLQSFSGGISASGATLNGTVTATTQPVGTNNTTLATTAFVQNEIVADTVTSFNGNTGAVTGVTVGGANVFTQLNTFQAGISASTLYVSGITQTYFVQVGTGITFNNSIFAAPVVSTDAPTVSRLFSGVISFPSMDRTDTGTTQDTLYGFDSRPQLRILQPNNRFYGVAYLGTFVRGSSADLSTNTTNDFGGIQIISAHSPPLPETAYSRNVITSNFNASNNSGTMNSLEGVRIQGGYGNISTSSGVTVGTLYGLRNVDITVGHISSGKTATVQNWYQIWLGRGTTAGLGVIGSNRWGIFQTDPLNSNYFAGGISADSGATFGGRMVLLGGLSSAGGTFTSATSFTSGVTVSGRLDVGGVLDVVGGVTLESTLDVVGAARFAGTVTGATASFSRLASFADGLSAAGGVTFANDITVSLQDVSLYGGIRVGRGGGDSFCTHLGSNSVLNGSSSTSTTIGFRAGGFSRSNGSVFVGFGSGWKDQAVGITSTNDIMIGTQVAHNWANDASSNSSDNVLIGGQCNRYGSGTVGSVGVGAYALNQNTASGSVGVGYYALSGNTNGTANTAVGWLSLRYNTAGYNTAVGNYSMGLNTTGDSNTAVGRESLVYNSSGSSNTAVGKNSSWANTTASHNTAIGSDSQHYGTTGAFNTSVGSQSLFSNVTGSNNIAIGYQALFLNKSDNNVAIGNQSLDANTTGIRNVALGNTSLSSNTVANHNVAIGHASLQSTMTGGDNTGVGAWSLSGNTAGIQNTAIGYAALLNNVWNANTAIGFNAARYYGTGTDDLVNSDSSTFLGYNTRPLGNGQNNQIVIGYSAIGDGSSTTVIGNSSTTSTRVFGTLSTNGGLSAAGATLSGAVSVSGLATLTAGLSAAGGVTFSGHVQGTTASFSGHVGIGAGGFTTSHRLFVNGSFAATTKSFVIPHPTKPGKQLQYGSLEGPENGVYVRGKSESPLVFLPDYWHALVDENSLTVTITPYGEPQNLWVAAVDTQKLVVYGSDTPRFYYTVWGERKDVPKLEVEV